MKAIEKIDLIGKVAKALDRQYVLSQIKNFLTEFGIETPKKGKSASDAAYVRNRLRNISEISLIEMAMQLGIDTSNLTTSPVKAFISHSSKNKQIANAIRGAFKKYNIESFVSGKDIRTGELWQKKIKTKINEMDFFVALHTKDFSKSLFCQQEAGMAILREEEIEIVPINYNLKKVPDSFLVNFQYFAPEIDNVEAIIKNILKILQESQKTKDLYITKIAPYITDSNL